ncbi:unnamed protein product [Ceratitis capitata]|uniref:(Mediterranean fruit fly) hypothetical protein n=1 Tax=Ceratitis capitata TaxID=7213 RepID=A0A811UAS5_CERCA|nr:unnamed protein product [Ceratitis capitata]
MKSASGADGGGTHIRWTVMPLGSNVCFNFTLKHFVANVRRVSKRACVLLLFTTDAFRKQTETESNQSEMVLNSLLASLVDLTGLFTCTLALACSCGAHSCRHYKQQQQQQQHFTVSNRTNAQ